MESTGSFASDDTATADESIADRFPRIVAVIRTATALLGAGVVGAGFWLAIMQEGDAGRIFNHRWTNHAFPDGLGSMLGYHEHARAGMVATLVIGVGVAIIFALIERFLPGRGWVKGLSFSPLIFLAWGLIFCPLVDARQVILDDRYAYLSDTIFATQSGRWTLASAVVGSIAAGIAIARVLQVVRTAEWWTPKDPARHKIFLQASSSGTAAMTDPNAPVDAHGSASEAFAPTSTGLGEDDAPDVVERSTAEKAASDDRDATRD